VQFGWVRLFCVEVGCFEEKSVCNSADVVRTPADFEGVNSFV
jgi:hypothetical protein